VKFFTPDSQAIYLSRRGALPPPLRFFDVYYTSYPTIGFIVIGSSSSNEQNVVDGFTPDWLGNDRGSRTQDEVFEYHDDVAEDSDTLLAHISDYGQQTGDMDEVVPMRFPSRSSGNLSQTMPAIRSLVVIDTPSVCPADIKHFIVIDGEP
jgi:hypothetical protein